MYKRGQREKERQVEKRNRTIGTSILYIIFAATTITNIPAKQISHRYIIIYIYISAILYIYKLQYL